MTRPCARCQARPRRPNAAYCRLCRTVLRRAHRDRTRIKGHEGYRWKPSHISAPR